MPTVTNLLSESTSGNSDSYTSASFTANANDLLVVFAGATATGGGNNVLTASQAGLTFTLSTNQTKNARADKINLWIANAFATTSSMTVSTSYFGDPATGQIIAIAGVAGMSRKGLAAVLQTGGESDSLAGTPAPAFAAAVTSSNPVLGYVDNATNPATMTPPAGWTEAADIGHATPVHGGEWAFINSGSTLTTITWGSASASIFGDIVVELDGSSTGAAALSTVNPRLFAALGVGV